MYSCIFEDHANDDETEVAHFILFLLKLLQDVEDRILEETDHTAVISVHSFLQVPLPLPLHD